MILQRGKIVECVWASLLCFTSANCDYCKEHEGCSGCPLKRGGENASQNTGLNK